MEARCPACGNNIEIKEGQREYICPGCNQKFDISQFPTILQNPEKIFISAPEATKIYSYPPDARTISEGTTIGNYVLLELLGKGGMGMVYKARHTRLNRLAAIKILSPELARDNEFVQRFETEAQALATLNHPHIVTLYDMANQGEIYYLVMEFVEGMSLRAAMHTRKFIPKEAIKIILQVLEALDYAHSRGILHRDIKPENVLLDAAGNVKIADFGIAKIIHGDTHRPSLTQSGYTMGTVDYMSPEQREGLKKVDHRSDIYSTGVVFYELLTGTLPVGYFEMPSQKCDVDKKVDGVISKMLAADPEKRYQSARDVINDLAEKPPEIAKPVAEAVPEKRISYEAIGALHSGFVGLLICQLLVSGLIGLIKPEEAKWLTVYCAFIMALTFGIGAVLSSIAGWRAIVASEGRLTGRGYSIMAFLLGVFLLVGCATKFGNYWETERYFSESALHLLVINWLLALIIVASAKLRDLPVYFSSNLRVNKWIWFIIITLAPVSIFLIKDLHLQGSILVFSFTLYLVISGLITTKGKLRVKVAEIVSVGKEVIQIEPGDSLFVKGVSSDIQISGCDEMRISIETGIKKVERAGKEIILHASETDAKLRAYKNMPVSVSTIAGDIDVNNLDNGVVLSSISGDLSVSKVTGQIHIKTTSGEINLRDASTNDMNIRTTSGDVNIHGFDMRSGYGCILTYSGDIRISALCPTCAFGYVILHKGKKEEGAVGDKVGMLEIKSLSGEVSIAT